GRLSPTDTTRIARALEVVRSTGVPLAKWQAQRKGGIGDAVRLSPLVLLPPRDWLMAQCDARFDAIFEHGRDEVRALTTRGLDPALPVMRAIGVREIAEAIEKKVTESHAKEQGRLATRQYAKRQYTWFRGQAPKDCSILAEPLNSIADDKLAIKLLS
ncbi:MAG: tRNA (adenosine(37)-N6)-dimethylallyltransferase MiaA, partial [Sphingomonadaceae bacterium]|nr:tRNA (adenosine(37)-N6)-dimethylallyltransferase MiaA [Sphingomonadaceae bacterium]